MDAGRNIASHLHCSCRPFRRYVLYASHSQTTGRCDTPAWKAGLPGYSRRRRGKSRIREGSLTGMISRQRSWHPVNHIRMPLPTLCHRHQCPIQARSGTRPSSGHRIPRIPRIPIHLDRICRLDGDFHQPPAHRASLPLVDRRTRDQGTPGFRTVEMGIRKGKWHPARGTRHAFKIGARRGASPCHPRAPSPSPLPVCTCTATARVIWSPVFGLWTVTCGHPDDSRRPRS
jgi:hypothetical protein